MAGTSTTSRSRRTADQAAAKPDPAASAPAAALNSQCSVESTSPVLAVIQKRIRNVKKRLRTISDIEAKRDAGKPLNADQVAT